MWMGRWIGVAALGLMACGQDQAPPPAEQPAAPVTEQPAATETATPVVESAPTAQPTLMDQALEATKAMTERAQGQATEAVDALPALVDSVVSKATSASDAVADQAATLVEQVKTLISEERIAEARTDLARLEGIKDSLSAELQQELERLEAMLPAE
jgi:hypothetical protein